MIEKHKKDGKVAVLYSPGFGAGWSTWASQDTERMIFDPELVEAVLSCDHAKMHEVAKRNFPDAYDGGVDNLAVCWLNEGERFEIREYDGNESVQVFGPSDGIIA